MFEVLTNFLDSKIDYQTILAFIGLYLVALWLMFCFWVFTDANKRYKNPVVSVLMALLVFVFNFPALIFYLIVRPEHDDFADYAVLDTMGQSQGGVQVPIVNFVGEGGEVQMSLNLKIHSQMQPNSDMVIDVGWESNNPKMQSAAMPQTNRPTLAQQADAPVTKGNEQFRKRWDNLREKAKGQLKNVNTSVSSSMNASVSEKTNPKAAAKEEKKDSKGKNIES